MIYEGKEYEKVTDGSAEIGDLIHVTEVESEVCDIWCFTTDSCINHPDIDVYLLNGWETLNEDTDVFTRYRYVKDVEEKPIEFKTGDRVKVIGATSNGKNGFIGLSGEVKRKNIQGTYRVEFGVIVVYHLPYESLELIEESPVPKEKIIPLTNPKKAHDLINQTSKIIKQTDTVNSPSHYNQTKIEAIDIIEDVTAGYQSNVKYHIGNAIKYLIRAPFKNNTVEDLKKAVWYIQRAIEKLEGEK